MRFSRFGNKMTGHSGILELMDDLGTTTGVPGMMMLGGGNPAHIPEMNALWRSRMEEILSAPGQFESMLANYDTPGGKISFLETMARFLSDNYGWNIGPENIAITNGSQSAFFYLFNLFGGVGDDGISRKIHLPLVPEYIGYADQGVQTDLFVSHRPRIEDSGEGFFKYRLDIGNLQLDASAGALCVSRPTNPTGNVLTDDEINSLIALAGKHDIPLFIDNAYGTPFPGIIFTGVNPHWDEHVILGMSLSKLGLPGTRTGIIVAQKDVIKALSGINAIVSLANGSVGQVITQPLFASGEILALSRDIIRPYYEAKSRFASLLLLEHLSPVCDVAIHKSEGAIFLWVWIKNLPITSRELYCRLKARKVIIVPGEYFFFGLAEPWEHSTQCFRLNYSGDAETVRRGIEIIADEVRMIMHSGGL